MPEDLLHKVVISIHTPRGDYVSKPNFMTEVEVVKLRASVENVIANAGMYVVQIDKFSAVIIPRELMMQSAFEIHVS